MDIEIFLALAKELKRPDLIGPLAFGRVATDLFAYALGLKCPSSLFKKLEKNRDAYPPLHEPVDGSRRGYFLCKEIETWHTASLKVAGDGCVHVSPIKEAASSKNSRRRGRPGKSEQREAIRRGISVSELRRIAASGAI